MIKSLELEFEADSARARTAEVNRICVHAFEKRIERGRFEEKSEAVIGRATKQTAQACKRFFSLCGNYSLPSLNLDTAALAAIPMRLAMEL